MKLSKEFATACSVYLLTVTFMSPGMSAGTRQVPAASQSTPLSGEPRYGRQSALPEPTGPLNPQHMEKLREEDRRKRLIADTERLVALTGELKAELAKSSKDELSLDVVRKAAEIERLAHDVKERMKS